MKSQNLKSINNKRVELPKLRKLQNQSNSLKRKEGKEQLLDEDYGISCALNNPKMRRIMESFGTHNRSQAFKKSSSNSRVYHPSKWSKNGWKYIDKAKIKNSYNKKIDMIGNYSLQRSKDDLSNDSKSTYQELHCSVRKNLSLTALKKLNPNFSMKGYHHKRNLKYPPLICSSPQDHYFIDSENSGKRLAQKHAMDWRSMSLDKSDRSRSTDKDLTSLSIQYEENSRKNSKPRAIERTLVGTLGLSKDLRKVESMNRKGRYKLWGGMRVPQQEGYFRRDKRNVDVEISSFLKKHYGKGMF
ncbi:unnamed protein product [Moneuplotes crassus]|uniref:Uncharacterized protein n=1 Tax=Euplotes crassus TaxID=5936 RepID=A0AAD1UMW6_EUPCR|nr:unnamed protein product [Moneuplotes crassus]